MTTDPKKIAAALAVLELLREEEEAFQLAFSAPRVQLKETPWALSGRQNHMQLRQFMQLKGFHRN